MSQGDILLDTLSEKDVGVYTANPTTEEHIVIGSDRYVKVPDSLKRIAVQFDHNVETVTFDCPRYWDGLDMSQMVILINYRRPDGEFGACLATNVIVDKTDDTIMHFRWTISKNVTMVKGNLAFLVCIKKTDIDGNEANHWNSELNKEMYVSEGLECGTPLLELYPDVITQILTEMSTADLEPGEGNNSIVQSEANNKAISDSSIALGKNSVAGSKGYYIDAIDFKNKRIRLSNVKSVPSINKIPDPNGDLTSDITAEVCSWTNGTIEFRAQEYFQAVHINVTYSIRGLFLHDEYGWSDFTYGPFTDDFICDFGNLTGPGGDFIGVWHHIMSGSEYFTDTDKYRDATVCDVVLNSASVSQTSSFETPDYSVGDYFTIKNGSRYENCGKIAAISHDVVTYDGNLPFTDIAGRSSFSDYMPTAENGVPIYHGDWDCGAFNLSTKEYVKYDTLEPSGDWACMESLVWNEYGGFNLNPAHPNYENLAHNLGSSCSPTICYHAPKNGQIKVMYSKISGYAWHLSIYKNSDNITEFDLAGRHLDDVNESVSDIVIPVVTGDRIYFVATRTDEYDWACTMMPRIVYDTDCIFAVTKKPEVGGVDLGKFARAEGLGAIATEEGQTAVGKYNVVSPTAVIMAGCGTSDENRANCFEAGNDDGDAYIMVGNTKITETQMKSLLALLG